MFRRHRPVFTMEQVEFIVNVARGEASAAAGQAVGEVYYELAWVFVEAARALNPDIFADDDFAADQS